MVTSIHDMRRWSTRRIRYEIRDQERWLRKPRASDFDPNMAYEYLSRLRQVLAERRR